MESFIEGTKILGALMSFFMGCGGFAEAATKDLDISCKIGYGIIGTMGIIGGASVIVSDMILNDNK